MKIASINLNTSSPSFFAFLTLRIDLLVALVDPRRANFISRLKEGERMSDLCEEFGISRKTRYKIQERYKWRGLLVFSTKVVDQI